MSCLKAGGIRCSDCCKVVHIKKGIWNNLISGAKKYTDGEMIRKIWTPVSKRQAKKINPYMVAQEFNEMDHFTCKNYSPEGCTDYENRPQVCRVFTGEPDYSPTCVVDYRVFARFSQEAA